MHVTLHHGYCAKSVRAAKPQLFECRGSQLTMVQLFDFMAVGKRCASSRNCTSRLEFRSSPGPQYVAWPSLVMLAVGPVLEIRRRRFTPTFLGHSSLEHAEAADRNLCSHLWLSAVSEAGEGQNYRQAKFDSCTSMGYLFVPVSDPSAPLQIRCTFVTWECPVPATLLPHPPGCTIVESPQDPRPHFKLCLQRKCPFLWVIGSHPAVRWGRIRLEWWYLIMPNDIWEFSLFPARSILVWSDF